MTGSEEDRFRREAHFHDRWAHAIDPTKVLVDEIFTAVTAMENAFVHTTFGDVRGKRLLDYGCGAAEAGVYFAKQGASVVGVDVSEGMLAVARKLADHHGVHLETRRVSSVRLPADDREFDLVYGNGVLHHVDLSLAIPELARVMNPDAVGAFIEPLSYNPVIDIYRHLAKTVRTRDERPLDFRAVERFKTSFWDVDHREFWLLTLSVFAKFFLLDRVHPAEERYWKKIYTDAPRVEPWFKYLRAVDDALLRRLPLLRYLCWNTVIRFREPLRRVSP